MGLIAILGLVPQQLWRAQFVRSSWDPAASRPYLVKAWWKSEMSPRPPSSLSQAFQAVEGLQRLARGQRVGIDLGQGDLDR